MTAPAPRFWSLLLLLFLSGASRTPGEAQSNQIPEAARKLIAVNITGTRRYAETQDRVVAASGLQIGTIAVEDDFKKAARHLGDSGAFADIGYSYSYSGAGTKLEFRLADADKFLPAHFKDFVWFSDDELRRRLEAHVPLFNGELPVSGRMAEEVSDVLQAMLVELGVPGIVRYDKFSPEGGPAAAFNYHVDDVLIRIRNFEFTGAGGKELPQLESAGQRLADRQYSRERINTFIERQLLPIFRARGYLKAAFGAPVPKVVKEPPVEGSDEPRNQSIVDVTLPVVPGRQYNLTGVEWSGNKEFPAETLQPMLRAKPGQPANTVQLADDLASVRTLYGSKGYMNVSLTTEGRFDEAAGTVVLHVDVKEDTVYHMGELEFRGLDNSLTAKLRAVWKLRPGDVYDATYLKDYLPQANRLLPASLDWEPVVHVTANVREKTVDVDVLYTAKAPR